MHFEWLIPVIFLVVWILSSLIQGAERERSRMNRSRPLPGGERPPGDRASRRPPTDIDRFLEEVNRRRRDAAERRPGPSGQEKPLVPTVGPVVPGVRPRVSTRPSGRPAVPVQPVPSRAGRIPEALPVMQTAAAAEVLAVASALHAAPVQTSPSRIASQPSGTSPAAENPPSALPPLAELLRAPDNLRTAVILHEIFGPPRASRSGIR